MAINPNTNRKELIRTGLGKQWEKETYQCLGEVIGNTVRKILG